ncbi:MAG: rhodanese-like domain-containing protein, partial [Holophaga sp.]|nr:rhodanese-like domain-containing protein [Holophaga sp.]
VVDLRTRQEFSGPKGHIRSAINLPMSELVKRMDELDTSHPRAFLLVDETDKIAHEAVSLLSARGHQWVYVLKGGMRAWRRAKLPVYVIHGKSHH